MAERDYKKWIEQGMFVEHIVQAGICLTVDEIIREKGTNDVGRSMIKGVKCHWLTKDGVYQEGIFHTKELRPFTAAALAEFQQADKIRKDYENSGAS